MYDINGTALSEMYNLYGHPIDSDDSYISGRTLVFEDTFNSINTANWSFELGRVRNNELQFYTNDNRNVEITEENTLCITARREAMNGASWTSASLTSAGLNEFTYGRFEAKIKLPGIVGSFPAFWLLGANLVLQYYEDGSWMTHASGDWPECGEVDIVEGIPGNATTAQANLWKYTGGSFGGGRSATINLADWHVYACEWTSEYIAMLVDGVEYKRYTFADYNESEVQAYKLPMYMIINLAMGASGGTPPDDVNEMKMYVDWVRVYAPLT